MPKQLSVFILLGISFLVCSCEWIKTAPVFEDLYKNEVESINWKEVDELPTLEPCRIFKSNGLKKQCFFNIINDSIYTKLLRKSNFYLFTEVDTIRLIVTITTQGTLKFSTRFPTSASAYEQKKVDSIIQLKLINFPKIYPATKRGLPVVSNYEIPLVLLPYKK